MRKAKLNQIILKQMSIQDLRIVDLAKRLKVSKRTVYRWLEDLNKISIKQLKELSNALGITAYIKIGEDIVAL